MDFKRGGGWETITVGCGFGKGSWEKGLGVDLIEMEWAVVPQLALATHSPRQSHPHFNYHLMQCPEPLSSAWCFLPRL